MITIFIWTVITLALAISMYITFSYISEGYMFGIRKYRFLRVYIASGCCNFFIAITALVMFIYHTSLYFFVRAGLWLLVMIFNFMLLSWNKRDFETRWDPRQPK